MRLNKKAEIGDTFVWIIAIVLIFFIMVFFIIGSGSLLTEGKGNHKVSFKGDLSMDDQVREISSILNTPVEGEKTVSDLIDEVLDVYYLEHSGSFKRCAKGNTDFPGCSYLPARAQERRESFKESFIENLEDRCEEFYLQTPIGILRILPSNKGFIGYNKNYFQDKAGSIADSFDRGGKTLQIPYYYVSPEVEGYKFKIKYRELEEC